MYLKTRLPLDTWSRAEEPFAGTQSIFLKQRHLVTVHDRAAHFDITNGKPSDRATRDVPLANRENSHQAV